MSYATPADLIARKSASTLGALASDSGAEVAAGELATNSKILAALISASGAVEAALLVGGRYSVSDLTGLPTNAAGYLKQIVCDIAMAYLYARKPTYSSDDYKAALDLQETHLERLRKGQNIFNIDQVIDAGAPSVASPSVAEIQSQLLIRDRAYRYYPPRQSQSG